jgi:hypothetical protein
MSRIANNLQVGLGPSKRQSNKMFYSSLMEKKKHMRSWYMKISHELLKEQQGRRMTACSLDFSSITYFQSVNSVFFLAANQSMLLSAVYFQPFIFST